MVFEVLGIFSNEKKKVWIAVRNSSQVHVILILQVLFLKHSTDVESTRSLHNPCTSH